MNDHVLLNLSNDMRKKDEMRGLIIIFQRSSLK